MECGFFWAESITLRTHWILVVMGQYTRQIIGFGVHAVNVDGHSHVSSRRGAAI